MSIFIVGIPAATIAALIECIVDHSHRRTRSPRGDYLKFERRRR